eukprot:2593822-Amphidinium_carterae.2
MFHLSVVAVLSAPSRAFVWVRPSSLAHPRERPARWPRPRLQSGVHVHCRHSHVCPCHPARGCFGGRACGRAPRARFGCQDRSGGRTRRPALSACASAQGRSPAGPVLREHLTVTEIPVAIPEANGVYIDRVLKLHFVPSRKFRNIFRWQTTSRPRYTGSDRALPSAALQMWIKAHGSKCRDLTAVTAALDALRVEEITAPPPGRPGGHLPRVCDRLSGRHGGRGGLSPSGLRMLSSADSCSSFRSLSCFSLTPLLSVIVHGV